MLLMGLCNAVVGIVCVFCLFFSHSYTVLAFSAESSYKNSRTALLEARHRQQL